MTFWLDDLKTVKYLLVVIIPFQVVSCTEIVKRKFKSPKPLYQLTKISYRTVDEHWDPKTEDLDPIKVTREIPQIDILLRAMIFNDCANMSSSFDAKNSTLDVFLNVNSVKNSTKKKKFKVMKI